MSVLFGREGPISLVNLTLELFYWETMLLCTITSQTNEIDRSSVNIPCCEWREEVLAFYDKHICRDSAQRRKVSCFVVPVDESKMTPTADGELTLEQPKKVDNIEDMKAGLELHPALTKFKQPSEFSRSTEGSQ